MYSVKRLVDYFDIKDNAIRDRHVPTGEIHGSKIRQYSIPNDRIPTGELTFNRLKMQILHVGPIPDVDTEYAHNLGVTPEFVCIQETIEGVLDRVYLVTKSTTSVTVRAAVSGVYAYIYLIA